MTQEEKARAYDEAIKKAKEINNEHKAQPFDVMLKVFPELKESEDEKVRKELINFFSKGAEYDSSTNGIKDRNIIAWLEKQESVEEIVERCKTSWYNEGKIQGQIEGLSDEEKYQQGWHDALENQGIYKTTDKVELKFKVGDWVTNGHATCQITFIDSRYWYSETCVLGNVIDIDKAFHLWTIQDAKPGDILCTYECDEPKIVFILKGMPKKGYALSYYCYYNIMYPSFKTDKEMGCIATNDIKPATKEQCELLFQKMKEAGYEWDAENKKLKKSQRMISAEAKEAMYSKPNWSEEDDRLLRVCMAAINGIDNFCSENKQELTDWIKSLKERYTWKPSDEQMELLETLVEDNNQRYFYPTLNSLYEQLKKLKGE